MTSRSLLGILILLVEATSGFAQPIQVVSTIESSATSTTSADIVERRIRQLAEGDKGQWAYRHHQSCEAITGVLGQPAPVVVLTTSACSDRVSAASGLVVSASVGSPIYLYALAENPSGPIQNRTKVGILNSADKMQRDIQDALNAVTGSSLDVVTGGETAADLLAKLKSRTLQLAAIVEDGSGSGIAAFEMASDNALNKVPVKSAMPPAANAPVARALVLPSGFVKEPLVKPLRTRPDAILVLPLKDLPASARRDSPVAPYARWIPAEQVVLAAQHETRSERPLRIVVPVLITKGAVPDQIRNVFAEAQLLAPIDALINPCDDTSKNQYRAFLRSAVQVANVDPARGAAIWEHAKLLESRDRTDRLAYGTQRQAFAQAIGTPPTRARGLDSLAPVESGECKLPWRSGFRNHKLAYYQQSVNWLREALNPLSTPEESKAATNKAAVCLAYAFRQEQGETPTCGEPTSGGWTAYYAPFLPAAVINSGASSAGRR